MKINCPSTIIAKALMIVTVVMPLLQCSDEYFTPDPAPNQSPGALNESVSGSSELTDCTSCAYVVDENVTIVDGAVLGLKPGSVIGLDARIKYTSLSFRNPVGTHDNPIIIRHFGGVVQIDGTGKNN